MNNHTLAKLNQVTSYPLLSKVGEPALDAPIQVKSWSDAVKHCRSRIWDDCILVPHNALSNLVSRADWNRGNQWKPMVEELRPQVVQWDKEFVGPILKSHRLPKIVADTLRWYALHICIETEYQDLVPPLFFLPLIDPWLGRGHFPCGWEGDEFPDDWDGTLPEGKLIVF